MAVGRNELLKYLSEQPGDITLQEIIKGLNDTHDSISPVLTALAKDGRIESPERGYWRITDKGLGTIGAARAAVKAKELPGDVLKPGADVETTEVKEVPGAYEKFMQIGRSCGIKEDFLKVMTDHLFLGDVYNLNYIWDTLNGMYLRPDVTKRIFNIWSRVINQPIPIEIASQIMPSTTASAKEAEARAPTRFTLIGDELVADPEGEFTFAQARQVLMTKAIQGAAPSLGGEKVSEIIGAIQPFMQQQQAARAAELEKQGEASVLATLVKSLIESKGGNAQQPLTLADMLTVVDKIDEARKSAAAAIAAGAPRQQSGFEEIERIVSLMDKMRGLFGGRGEGASPITIAVKGADGQTGAVPLETFFQIEDHRRKVRQEDEELDSKRETGKAIRGFLDKIAKAASNIASR